MIDAADVRTSRPAIIVLTLALIVGGYLRCTDLGAREMSADEGASWAAASAPTLRLVLSAQNRLNPGKAGVHDVALHLWMRAFGDSLSAMRALSALIGTITILLVFGASRELLLASRANCDHAINYRDAADDGPDATRAGETAAIAALVFAISLIAIKYSREVRMYPIVMAAVVAQTWCFLRAYRNGGIGAYAGVTIFTAIALAAHLTAVLAFTGEGLWLIYRLAKGRGDSSAIAMRRALGLFAALGAGAAMLAPVASTVVGSAADAANRGAIDWIKRPAPWAAVSLFNKGTGSFAFPAIAALAAWGCLRGWRRWRLAIVFALLWMWTPPLMLMLISYAIRPAFVERYLVSGFMPFFILAAIGIVELPGRAAQLGAVALMVALSIGHVLAWDRKPHDVQWREAVRAAITGAGNGGALAIAPGYAINVVRYYGEGNSAVLLAHPVNTDERDSAAVAIIGEQGVTPATAAALIREYPRVLAQLRGVVVRGR